MKVHDELIHALNAIVGTNSILDGIQQALVMFQVVFDSRKVLPPLRDGHNYPIILQKGTDPISLNLYRYSVA